MMRLLVFLLAVVVSSTVAIPVGAADTLSQLERIELQISYLRLTGEFYQKIDSQKVLDGAYERIVQDLDQKGIPHPSFAPARAINDARADARAFVEEVGS